MGACVSACVCVCVVVLVVASVLGVQASWNNWDKSKVGFEQSHAGFDLIEAEGVNGVKLIFGSNH